MQPGMSVSYVARRAGVAPSLLFNWRRRMLEGGLQAALCYSGWIMRARALGPGEGFLLAGDAAMDSLSRHTGCGAAAAVEKLPPARRDPSPIYPATHGT